MNDPVRYKLTLAYDGTDFSGWQKQEPPDPHAEPDAETGERPRLQLRTVQHVVEQTVRQVIREHVNIKGASRTDAGVHAAGQVAAFTSRPDPDRGAGWPADRGTDTLVRALNGRLPPDVLVTAAEIVPPDFDPVGGAIRKAYTYTIHTGQTRPLWDRRTTTWVYHDLDPSRMHRAAQHLVGEHDFVSFAQANHGRLTTVRTIFRCDVEQPAENRVRITVEGSGFLYNMVRIIAGTLVEIGRGKMPEDEIPRILASKDRTNAGTTMPPEGLRLEWVEYPRLPPEPARCP